MPFKLNKKNIAYNKKKKKKKKKKESERDAS